MPPTHSSIFSVFFAILVSLGVMSCADHSTTDLAINQPPVTDPIAPTVNQSILLTAQVLNLSGSFSSVTLAAVRVDGVEVVRLPIDALGGGESQTLSTAFRISTSGTHSIAVVIDPDEVLNDDHRSNNTFIFSISVGVALTSG